MWTSFLGHYNDQIYGFWWFWWERNYHRFVDGTSDFSPLFGAPFGSIVINNYNEPIIWRLFYGLALVTQPIFAYNVLLLLSVALTLYFTYRLSNRWFTKGISLFIAICFVFSTYLLEKISNHLALSQIWIIPAFYHYMLHAINSDRITAYFKSGLLLAIFSLISNYIGFFLIIFTVASFIAQVILNKIDRKVLFVLIKKYLALFIPVAIIIITNLFPYIRASYLGLKTDRSNIYQVARPIEDYFYFSARPWFYLLPSIKNPVFGPLTGLAMEKFKSTNYFLFNNYVPEEHSSTFFGWIPLVFAFLSIATFHKNRKSSITPKKIYIVTLLVFLLLAFLLSTPPYFTFNGYKIYLPGYLMYMYVKVFRVTARVGILMYLAVLQLAGFFLLDLSKKINSYTFTGLLTFFAVFNAAQMIIPLNVTSVECTPDVYSYIAKYTPTDSIIAVYPYSKSSIALYWMRVYERGLLNPRDFENTTFNASSFTKTLLSSSGIAEARRLGVDYIVLYKDSLVLPPSEELILEKEFTEAYLLKIKL